MLMFKVSCFILVLLGSAVISFSVDTYTRDDFPPGFVFGAATSAYQVEGAANEDGRTPSIWDTYTHQGKMNGANGDVAVDQYHKYKEDVKLMAETGLEAYRFSISWPRLIPHGRGPVNPKAIQYYNNLINELISHGIQPHVTLFHYDLPQELEDEYGGWVSRKIVKDFTAFADVCFREFGDRVSHWTTLNEPNIYVLVSYDVGILPPSRCSSPFGINCTKGNSSSEPYLAAHNMLLSHASAARLYREMYQKKQSGFVGISVFAAGFVPATNSSEDSIATQRFNDFFHGLIVNPVVFGDYPEIIKKIAGSRLPVFTKQESNLLKNSSDFLGLIHYATLSIKDNINRLKLENRDFYTDMGIDIGINLDNSSEVFQFPVAAWGLQGVLQYFKQNYGNPPIYILENGQQTLRNATLEDNARVQYLRAYIGSTLDAIRNGSNTRGYFVWSFLDVFELVDGYRSCYGLYYVDLDDPDLRRYPKLSARWYSRFLKGGRVRPDEIIKQRKEIVSSVRYSQFPVGYL